MAMVDLNGHEAGNGGYSQGTPTAHRVLLYSESEALLRPKGHAMTGPQQPVLKQGFENGVMR
jgi:hypothetical protein